MTSVRSRPAFAVLAVSFLAWLLAASPARAAVEFGSDLARAPDGAVCLVLSNPHSCTVALSTLPADHQSPGGVVAPQDGVIVGWKVRSGSQPEPLSVRLHVLDGNAGVAVGPMETLETSARIYSFAARIPVKKGDRLGLDFPEVPAFLTVPVVSGSDGGSFDLWIPMLAELGTQTPLIDEVTAAELLLNATLEPDLDRDGFGDETQDKCPGRADPSNACPPVVGGGPTVPDDHAPTTTIDKVRIQGGRATFRFSSPELFAKFRCKLDKKAWQKCKSPKVYKGLKAGRHSFKVKAIGTNGKPDRTPAKRSFRVSL